MHKTQKSPTVAIIGAGPAGLMAAEQLASKGFAVTIYDQMPSIGRKFLMAGRGGLNLTHSESLDIFKQRYGKAASWLAPILDAFPPDALIKWCHDLGQETFVGSSGRVFPRELKASPLLRAWLQRLNALDVAFELRHTWIGWNQKGNLIFENGKTVHADAVVLALGGASWPRLGSNGHWVDIIRNEGIIVTPLRPSNCGFVAPWSDVFRKRFAGQPLKPLSLSFADTHIRGEALVTQEGIEGGAIYALSAKIRDAIDAEGKAIVSLDLRPGLSIEDLTARLRTPRGSQSFSTYLRKALGLSPLTIGLMRESLEGAALPTYPDALARLVKDTKVCLTKTCDIARAISTAGGIACDEINADFMLKKKPSIFALGEMLDWEAPTGGYLLQASFSMAVVAAKGVARFVSQAQ